jgi:1,4-dihydroxy-2-naphthoate polyprenyltransferase
MVRTLVKISRPFVLLLATLTYTLGTGIAHYLGQGIKASSYLFGLLSILSILCAAFLFNEYFSLAVAPLEQGETFRIRERFRITLLQVSYATLTLAVVVILTLLLTKLLNLSAGILFILVFMLMIAYAVPPMRISAKGFGELVLAVALGWLFPAIALLLQFGQLHRLLSFSSFPLTLLALSYLLICNFPTFATDQKLGHNSLLTRLTWQRAIPIHHLLVLLAFMALASAPFLGIPWSLVGPVFLALPFGAIQIFWLQRIANGGRTLWNFLIAVSAATFGLAAYLMTLTFWIR